MSARATIALLAALLVSGPLAAQWQKVPDPKIPRVAGKPDLAAPAPRGQVAKGLVTAIVFGHRDACAARGLKIAAKRIAGQVESMDDIETKVIEIVSEQMGVDKGEITRETHFINDLNAATGADFDKTYANQQVDGHQDAASLFDAYAKKGDNAALKAFAQKTLPVIQQHLDEAKKLPR